MQREMDEWLEQKIDEDLDAWAEERMRMLMESEELHDIHMPEDSLEKLHQKINARKKKLLGRNGSICWWQRRGHDSAAWRGPGGQREEGV